MKNPKVLKVVKSVFHALTIASAALAKLPNELLPKKIAVTAAFAFAVISGLLNLLTTFYPELLLPE